VQPDLVLAVCGRGPCRIGGLLGGSDVDRDRPISLRLVRQDSVAGIDGKTRDQRAGWRHARQPNVAGWRSAGSGENRAPGIGTNAGAVGSGGIGCGAEERDLGIARAPGKRRMGNGNSRVFIKRIDGGRRNRNAASAAYGDRISRRGLSPDLQVDGLDEARRVWGRDAVGSRCVSHQLGDAGRFGGNLNLVEHGRLLRWYVRRCRENVAVRRRPVERADGVGDVQVVAVGDSLEQPVLPLGKAVVLVRLRLGLHNLDAVDVLVDVDDGGRAVDAVGDRVHGGDAGSAGAANRGGSIPGTGAAVAVGGHRKWRGQIRGVGRSAAAHYILNAHAGHNAATGVPGGGAEYLRASHVERYVAGGTQRDARHACIGGVAAALAEATGEDGRED
jgi:hypothetical protein